MTQTRGVLVAIVAVIVLGLAGGGGLYYQRRAAIETALADLVRGVEVELGRDTPDRATLVDLSLRLDEFGREHARREVTRLQVRLALAQRLPEPAKQRAEAMLLEAGLTGQDRLLAARAYALRHSLQGSQDDARQASGLAARALEQGAGVEAGLLAWQCATRIEDRERADDAAKRLTAAFPDAWETKVVAALIAFDPEQAASCATVREVFGAGPSLPELDLAIATLDVLAPDESARAQGLEGVKRVLAAVPAFKAARLVAVLAFDRVGDATSRDAHLRWLVQNYPNDPRAERWHGLIGD